MNIKIYIDMGLPIAALEPEMLSDKSTVWNIHIRGGEIIHCTSQKAGEKAMNHIAAALKSAGVEPLVF